MQLVACGIQHAPQLCYACCRFLLEHFCCLSGLLLSKHKVQPGDVGTPGVGHSELRPSQALREDLLGGRAERQVKFVGIVPCPLQSPSFP